MARAAALLDRATTEPNFRRLLDSEAKALTDIGNAFHIRHSETTQTAPQQEYHVDYLFHRLFGLVWILLVITGRL